MIQIRSVLVASFIFGFLCMIEAMLKSKLTLDRLVEQVSINEFRQANGISFPDAVASHHKIKVAIIDYGLVKAKKNDHEAFSKVITLNDRQPAGISYRNYLEHGIHVAGIIKGLNPKVELIGIQVSGIKDEFSDEIYAAIDEGVSIINISAGGYTYSKAERKALIEARNQGILVVTSAGNDNSDTSMKGANYFPAGYNLANIISVGALTRERTRLAYSNWGKAVDFYAPGDNIKSLSFDCKGLCSVQSGTSMAAPYLTALAAYVWAQNPDMPYQDVIAKLNKMAPNRKFFYK